MLYGFKKQFVPYIMQGSKTHTVRGHRRDGKVQEVGKLMHLYYGLRTKQCTFLFRAPCVGVEPIVIEPEGLGVEIAGTILTADERDLFAYRDGFRPAGTSTRNPGGSWDVMLRYWRMDLHKQRMDKTKVFHGHVNHWDFKKRVLN